MLTHLYRHFDAEGRLLYVGISLSAVQRLAQHRSTAKWFKKIARVELESFPDRDMALMAEQQAIRRERPLHNVIGAKGKHFWPPGAVTAREKAFGKVKPYLAMLDTAFKLRHAGREEDADKFEEDRRPALMRLYGSLPPVNPEWSALREWMIQCGAWDRDFP